MVSYFKKYQIKHPKWEWDWGNLFEHENFDNSWYLTFPTKGWSQLKKKNQEFGSTRINYWKLNNIP